MINPNNVPAFSVGKIGNYYGGLNLKVENGKSYWSIESYEGDDFGGKWEEIPDYLYAALVRFDGESKYQQKTVALVDI